MFQEPSRITAVVVLEGERENGGGVSKLQCACAPGGLQDFAVRRAVRRALCLWPFCVPLFGAAAAFWRDAPGARGRGRA